MAALPNFFLAGAPKSGTTALYHALGSHPEIYVSPVKEPGFFAADELRAWKSPNMRAAVERNVAALEQYAAGPMTAPLERGLALQWESYTKLFARVNGEIAIGEGSVVYSWAPSAPAAIHARLPNARFIFILRDPAERFFSHHLAALWGGSRATVAERFRRALDDEGEWRATLRAGEYATNLRRFLALFPREQLRVHRYEDLRSNPAAVLRDLFEFLGVRTDHAVDLSRRRNQPVVPRFPRLHSIRRAVLGDASLSRWLPDPMRRRIQSRYRQSRAELALDAADRRMLIDYYRAEIVEVAELLGWDLSAWLA